jgi:hypothetical protein
MIALVAVIGIVLIVAVLADAFKSIILPRRLTGRFRPSRLFYRTIWPTWKAIARSLPTGKRREQFLSVFGPLSILILFSFWAAGLIMGFSFLDVAAAWAKPASGSAQDFLTNLYLSGTTFFTLGMGDVTPHTGMGRLLAVLESGMGFGFLAGIIGYLPVIYQAFSRREANIVLLDARAGSPPTAAELLRRHAGSQGPEALRELLHDWEKWAADLLESHISYPAVSYFRSQHDNQSWLAALTCILDACALIISGIDGACTRQARLTFAIARHAVVDLAQVFHAVPRASATDRLPAAELRRLRAMISEAGVQMRTDTAADQKLKELREMYEPYVSSLGRFLAVTLPPWIMSKQVADNWKTSAWGRIAGFTVAPTSESRLDDHFEE